MSNRENTKQAYRLLINNLSILRKNNHINMREIETYLKTHGIHNNIKTIYGWENGVGTPSLDTLLLLCHYYGVEDIYALAGMKGAGAEEHAKREAFAFSEEEKKLILAFRERTEYQDAIRRLLLEKDTDTPE